MKALLRPVFVGGLSIAIAAANLVGASSVAFAAGTKPVYTSLSVPASVSEGDKPTVTGTFTDPDLTDQHTVQISWGDGSMDFYTLVVGDRSFSLQKSVGYPNVGANMLMQITLSDGSFSVSRFPSITVTNVSPSITSFALSSTDLNSGSAVTATGGFDDPGTGETHTVTVNWGDGSTPNTVLNLARRVWGFTTPPHTYTAGGTFTVTATVADNAGGSADATATVTVHSANQAPSVMSFGVTAATEGGSSTLSLTFSDADAADTHTVSVVWGDGSSTGPVSLDSTVTTYSTTHLYADTGTYAVGLTLDDNAGHSVTAAASVSTTNVDPVVGSLTLTPASVVDHQTVTLAGGFTDPGTADTFTLTIDWGDGKSSTQSLAAGTRTFSATHAYDAAGAVAITATVTDRDAGHASSTANLDVLSSNVAPADLVVQATPALEGGSTTLSVSFTDAATDTHAVAITWGDGSSDSVALAAGANSASSTHTYLETGTYTVAVTVTDGGNLSVAGGTTVTAANVSPSLSDLVLTPSSVTDHQAMTVTGTFSDPGTADTYTVTFDWGDGNTSSQSLSAGNRALSGSHEYATAGTYTVTVTVTDRNAGAGTKSASVFVTARNTAPSGLSLSKNVTGLSATVSGTFVDPDPLDSHDVTMLWGDGTTSTSTVAAGVTLFSATHTYLSAGTFTVTVTVTDPATAFTSGTTSVVTAAPASTVSDVLDQMAAFVESLGLSPNSERWLLRRIDDLRASAASGGNAQVCAAAKTLSHLSAYAGRVLTNDQAAALDGLGRQLEAAAGCIGTAIQNPKLEKTTRVPTTVLPTTEKRETAKDDKKEATPKTEKPDASTKNDKVVKTQKAGNEGGSRREGRNDR